MYIVNTRLVYSYIYMYARTPWVNVQSLYNTSRARERLQLTQIFHITENSEMAARTVTTGQLLGECCADT